MQIRSNPASTAPSGGFKPEGFGHGQLCAEHDLLGLQMQRIQTELTAGKLETAKAKFQQFRAALESHQRLEETILFPQFRQSGIVPDCELIGELCEEHEMIRGYVESIQERLDRDGKASELLEQLGAVLNAHESKEELFLYPMLFHLADPDFVAELFHSVHRRLVPNAAEPI